MASARTYVRGILLDASDGITRLSGLQVQVGFQGSGRYQVLTTETTDTQGRFVLSWSGERESQLTGTLRRYKLQVLQDGEPLEVSSGTTSWTPGKQPAAVTLQVVAAGADADPDDPVPAAPAAPFVGGTHHLRGWVRHEDGTSLGGVNVRICQRKLGTTESVLQNATTDEDGVYQTAYTPLAGTSAIFVRVYDEAGEDGEEIGVSTPLFSVSETERLDVLVTAESSRGSSEYTKIDQKISADLSGVTLSNVKGTDVSVLSGQHGLAPACVAQYIAARRLGTELSVDASVCYALLRQGGSAAADRLISQKPDDLRRMLKRAVQLNQVPRAVSADADTHVDSLQTARINRALSNSTRGAVAKLLSAVGITSVPAQQTFVKLYLEHEGDPDTFWARLGEASLWDADMVAKAKEAIKLGMVTVNHAPLVKALTGVLSTVDASEVVGLSVGDWQDLITSTVDGEPVGVPEGVTGESTAERIQNYAELLHRQAQRAFPSKAVAKRFQGVGGDIGDWLTSNQDFDFGASRVPTMENSALRRDLSAYQRLYRLGPKLSRYDTMTALYSGGSSPTGLHSAQQIARLPRATFLARYANVLDEDAASEMYGRARRQAAMAAALFAQHHPSTSSPEIAVVKSPPSATEVGNEDIPDYETIFGSMDSCACRECRSIHSPAAYLVDLLHWLDDHQTDTGDTYWDVLRARRPDLGTLLLGCDNTTKVLPYIDLVLEILENAVAGAGHTVAHDATTGTGDELLATPQYENTFAYNKVRDAVFPLNLPFSLSFLRARTHIQHMGVQRIALMEAVEVGTGLSQAPTNKAYAQEILGVCPEEYDLITTASGTPWTRWGYSEETPGGTSWVTTLASSVETFLKRAQIEYADLLDLLHGRVANAVGVTLTATDDCDLSTYALSGASALAFAQILQVLRLRRLLGWSFLTLDKVLYGRGYSVVDSDDMVDLSWVVRIHQEYDVPLLHLLSWWGHMDLREDREGAEDPVVPLYDEVYLSRLVSDDPDASVFALNGDRDALLTSGALASDNTSALQAALKLDAEGVAEAIAWAEDIHTGSTVHLSGGALVLDLTTLTTLLAICTLSRALGLSVRDAHNLVRMSSHTPFTDPEESYRLLKLARELRLTGLSVDDLMYLLWHDADAASRVAPSEESLTLLLGKIREDLRALLVGLGGAEDPDGTRLSALLDEVLEPFELDPDVYGEEDLPGVRDDILEIVASQATLTLEDKALLEAALGDYLRVTPLAVSLDALSPSSALPARYALVYNTIVEGVALVRARTVLAQDLSVALGITTDTVNDLRSRNFEALPGISDLADPFLDLDFLDPTGYDADDPYADLDRATYGDPYNTLELLYKVARVYVGLKLDGDESAAFLSISSSILSSYFPVTELPIVAPETTSNELARFKRFTDLFAQRARLPGDTPTFASLLETMDNTGGDSVTALITALVERTTWDADALTAIAEHLEVENAADLLVADTFRRLLDAHDATLRSGADFSTVLSWTELLGWEAAESAVHAARSRYTTAEAWSAAARPLRDVSRAAQRDALVAYLLGTDDDFEDTTDLYGHYLIDVDMSPAMLTARIKQATCSVQQFVFRAMMGLEDGITFGSDDRERWEWSKTYRVWEAARKVFLYPENWLEPELRDDRTEMFRRLERDIAQSDIRDEAVEEAMLRYLDKLLEVGNLSIVGVHHQVEEDLGDGAVDILHVFGRTRTRPYAYYYRRWEDQATWTAWEKVDLDLQTSHMVPVVHNRRLLLFWAEFTSTSTEDGSSSTSSKFTWNVRLNMAEYRNGQWSPRASTEEGVDLASLSGVSSCGESDITKDNKQYYGFVPSVDTDGDLTITLYYCNTEGNDQGAVSRTDLYIWTLNDVTNALQGDEADLATGDRLIPTEMNNYYQNLRRASDSEDNTWPLNLCVGDLDDEGQPITSNVAVVAPLANMYGAGVAFPNQYDDFLCQDVFFVQDKRRVFFVVPTRVEDESAAAVVDTSNPKVGATGRIVDSTLYQTRRTSSATVTSDSVGYFAALTSSSGASSARVEGKVNDVLAMVDLEAVDSTTLSTTTTFTFQGHFHPYVPDFIAAVRRNGIMGLLDPADDGEDAWLQRQDVVNNYFHRYVPDDTLVLTPRPSGEIEFDAGSAYGQYNWEVFYHAPMYVAKTLSTHQRFDEALRWYHTIFDPRVTPTEDLESPYCYWKVKPFLRPVGDPVTDWAGFTGSDGDSTAAARFEAQVAAWEDDPFDPHAVAALRTSAYQRATVMKYLDNLIAWGDSLFRQDTIETINEATQLYVYASQILGRRPDILPPREDEDPLCFNDLRDQLDDFSNPVVMVENALYTFQSSSSARARTALPDLSATSYFCVPPNPKLLGYWDTVEDRLYKIRNGMNIEGVVRSLQLYEPPIDPGALVAAAAAGADVSTVLAGLSASVPPYRFTAMLARANAFCGSVKALGNALQGALEKRDAEELSQIRGGQEIAVLEAALEIRKQSVKEAKDNLEAAKRAKATVQARADYYQGLISVGEIAGEKEQESALKEANKMQNAAQGLQLLGTELGLIPELDAGYAAAVEFGGRELSTMVGMYASMFSNLASNLRATAELAAIKAGHDRRKQEWKQQLSQAKLELKQHSKTISAAEKRVEMAEKEVKNQKLQIENARAIDTWMRHKFTNLDLYDWMLGQVSAVYFQAFQLAVDMARRAEACYRYELALPSASFVGYGNWDSLKRGLLAGERLESDLQRMEASYLLNDKRELELVKHASLRMIDPVALLRLRELGECYVDLPEAVFDADCPGHYLRRLVSVSVTVACVSGPMSGVNLELTLQGSRIRTSPSTSGSPTEDAATYPRIVTSSAQDDSGLHQVNLQDPRYLPFERKGAVSTWSLRLTAQTVKQLDWDTITDVVLHLRYTARDGGAAFRGAVEDTLDTDLNALTGGWGDVAATSTVTAGLQWARSAKLDDPDAWYSATSESEVLTDMILDMEIDSDHLPAALHTSAATATRLRIGVTGLTSAPDAGDLLVAVNGDTLAEPATGTVIGNTHVVSVTITTLPSSVQVTWSGGRTLAADVQLYFGFDLSIP